MTTVPYYDSAARGSPFVREFTELLRYRDLLRLMVARDLVSRYKRSVLGVLWTLLNPLLTMTVMALAFSTLFRFRVHTYPVYLLSGLVLWNFFTHSTTTAMNSLVKGGSLLQRIYVPRTLFTVSAIGTGLITLLISLLPLAGLALILGTPLRPALLFLPAAVILGAMFALGVALWVSTLAAFFVDVADLWGVVLRAWFYLTPIMYPESIFPERYAWVLNLNPMHHIIECFRAPIHDGLLPGPNTILAAAVSSLLTLLAGWWIFARKADEFSYRV